MEVTYNPETSDEFQWRYIPEDKIILLTAILPVKKIS
jgi:hypothetical protein